MYRFPRAWSLLAFIAPFTAFAQTVDPFPRAPIAPRLGDFTLKAEPAIAFPMSNPQRRVFQMGASQTVKGLFALSRYLDVGPAVAFMSLPSEAADTDSGTAWMFGGSVRLKRPHDLDTFAAVSPWMDVDLMYVRTGDLKRAGFAAAAGLAIPIGDARSVWAGPFVRYFQILSGSRDGFDTHDANIFNAGISVELGSGVRRVEETTAVEKIRTVSTRSETAAAPTPVVGDGDHDGVLDDVDHCIDVAGTAERFGCPEYAKVIVKRDKLELKEKLYFQWDEATLEPVSFAALDDVVQALKDNKNFTVQVEGHASSDGDDDHNQTLSEKRAQTVLDYLVAHGIGTERLRSKGFSSSVPADTNSTAIGRENNRRVEFVVSFLIVKDGSN